MDSFEKIGFFLVYLKDLIVDLWRPPYRVDLLFKYMYFMGNQSIFILVISAFAIGGAFAIQVGSVFKIFTAEGMIGGVSAVAFSRELAPLLTGSLLAGRVGSAITAEIATMKINEQIEALHAMGINIVNYLVKPRVLAGVLIAPLLTIIFILIATIGSYFMSLVIFGVDKGIFIRNTTTMLDVQDIIKGLQKAILFGFVIPLIACWYGLKCKGGAKGVGQATTVSVIASLLAMLIIDFVITYFQLR